MITYTRAAKLEIPSQIHQKLARFYTAIGVAALSSLTDISARKKPIKRANITRVVFTFLVSAISVSLISLSVSAIIVNVQAYSSGIVPVSNNSTSSINQSTTMGICVVGAGGPCNGESNMAK
jgi:hypothetical protein